MHLLAIVVDSFITESLVTDISSCQELFSCLYVWTIHFFPTAMREA